MCGRAFVCTRVRVRADPSLEGHSDLGLVGDEPDGRAQHLVLGALDGVRLDADHLPADLLEGQDLGRQEVVWSYRIHAAPLDSR